MSEARTPQSDYLLTLGKRILLPYTQLPYARAAMVTGSVAEGVSDNYSDLDLMVYYADELPDEKELTRVRLENGALERLWLLGDRGEGAIIEAYQVHGVQAQIVHTTIEAWERDIAQVLEKFDTNTPLHKAMSGTLEAITVFGDEYVNAWQERIAVYPDELARAMVVNHLQFFPYWAVQNQLGARDALIWHYQILTDACFNLIAVLAGLNHLYFTPFQFKKMRQFLNRMPRKPEHFAERLENLFIQEPAAAARALESLVAEVIALVQENMLDVDASGAKKSLRQRRPPWELVITKEQESV